jgi:hypothetical protein
VLRVLACDEDGHAAVDEGRSRPSSYATVYRQRLKLVLPVTRRSASWCNGVGGRALRGVGIRGGGVVGVRGMRARIDLGVLRGTKPGGSARCEEGSAESLAPGGDVEGSPGFSPRVRGATRRLFRREG